MIKNDKINYILLIPKCPHNRRKTRCYECLADKDNRIPEVEEYTIEEYKILFLI